MQAYVTKKQLQIGELVEGKGVYIGIWHSISDRDNRKLNAEFKVFAAPQDTHLLTNIKSGELVTYDEEIARIADLQNICGHDGVMLANDTAIYDAIRTGNHAALARWHMPVKELFHGYNARDKPNPSTNLYIHHDKGALNSTFTDESGKKRSYWTASEYCSKMFGVSFHPRVGVGPHNDFIVDRDRKILASRPVRLEYLGPAKMRPYAMMAI